MAKENFDNSVSNLPACAIEYIKLVIKKMKWRKSVRADVQAELIGHFEDALRDCKNEDEKEKKAKELIANFGDAKLIADLSRRAKKRCRPMWIKTIIRVFQAGCIIFGLFVLYVLWFISGKPSITTNYIEVVNKMVRPTADDSQNAAPFYEKAAVLFEKQDTKDSECIDKAFAEANETDIAQIRQWLEKNSEILNLITQGAEKPYFWQTLQPGSPNDNSVISILMPHLGKYRKLAYGLRWRAYLSAEDKQYEKAFADLLKLYKLGKHQKGQKTLIENLVGIAIESMSTSTARTILHKYNVPAEHIRTFSKDFRTIIENENFTMADSFEFEKILVYDEMQRCFVKSGFGVEHLYPKRLSYLCGDYDTGGGCGEEPRQINRLKIAGRFVHTLFIYQNSEQTRLTLDKYYDFWKDVAAETPYQFKGCDFETEAYKIIKSNVLLRLLSPAMQKVIILSWRNRADVESTLAIAALHIFKQEKGYWPENLQELVSTGYLISLPLDPYSDKPLVYKKIENGFTLYSFGTDFDDDGGKKPEKFASGRNSVWPADGQDGDAVFWPVK